VLALGVVIQKLVDHHLPTPRPLEQEDEEAVLNRVLAGEFPGGPAGLAPMQQARSRVKR
jgi:hypothetical protein